MQYLSHRVESFKTWDLLKDSITSMREVKVDFPDRSPGQFAEFLIRDSLQESFTYVSSSNPPASGNRL